MIRKFLWLLLMTAACQQATQPAATDAGPVNDAGPGSDAGPAVFDGGVDAGPVCEPNATAVSDAGPNVPASGTGCSQDKSCPAGDFCLVASLQCTSATAANVNAGNGRGGYRADGGACVASLDLPQTCDATSLDWTPSIDISIQSTSIVESDAALAADGQGNIVAAWAKVPDPATSQSQVNQLAVSHDSGASFRLLTTPSDSATSAANDPTVAYSAGKGLWYYVWEGYEQNFSGAQHVWMSTSTGGDTWSAVAQVDTAGDYQPDGGSLDFPWVSVNPADGLPAVTYQAATATTAGERLVFGLPDGGFAASVSLDDGKRPEAYTDLAQTAFDESGNLYAAWNELNSNATELGGVESGAVGNDIFFSRFDRDADGGYTRTPADVQVNQSTEAVAFERPALAVAPDGSHLYVAYVVGTDNALNVEVVTSTDRGGTWSAPVVVNDDGTCATHFHESVLLDSSGRLYVFWYDNRDGDGHFFYAVSDDQGASFHPNRLVSAAVFPFDTFQYSTGWLGDYFEPAVTSGSLYVAWSDGRAGDQSHIYFASAPLP